MWVKGKAGPDAAQPEGRNQVSAGAPSRPVVLTRNVHIILFNRLCLAFRGYPSGSIQAERSFSEF